jgi:hypothetical protein
MYVGHQNTDNLVIFKVDKATGKLEYSGHQLLSPGQPVCILFQPPPVAGSMVNREGATFSAVQNPILADGDGLGTVTLGWNVPGATELELRVGAPDGTSMGKHPSYGVTTTGRWVTDNMTFYLQDISGGKPLTAANTVGAVRIQHRK